MADNSKSSESGTKAQGKEEPAKAPATGGKPETKPDAKPDAVKDAPKDAAPEQPKEKTEDAAKLTDAQIKALDRDGDGKAGGSISDAAIEQMKEDAYKEGYNDALIDSRENQEGGENPADIGQEAQMMTRSFLIAAVLRMPETMRRTGIKPRVDDLEAFLDEFDGATRYVAAEAIKAIAEVRPNDITSERYKRDVRNAVRVAQGEPENRANHVNTKAEQDQARARLNKVSHSNPVPSGFEAAPKETAGAEPVLDGDDEQNAAAKKLYTGKAK